MGVPGEKKWTDEQSQFLRDLIGGGASFAVAAAEINARFNTSFTRNAAIGRAQRIGLCSVRPRIVKKERPVRQRKERLGRSDPAFYRPLRETITIRCAEVEPMRVGLLDLQPHHCRYPYGDHEFTFCGHTVVDGGSYCQPHTMLCTRDDRRGNRTEESSKRFAFILRKNNISKAQIISSGNWADEGAAA